MSDSRNTTAITISAAWIVMVGIAAYAVMAIRLGPGFAIPVGIIGALSSAAILAGPIGKALAQRMGLRNPPAPNEVPEQVLGELDEMRIRMQELEERVDFSERLLAALPREANREQGKF